MRAKKHGFTLIEVMLVVAIIAIISAIVIPAFQSHHKLSQQSACIANIDMLNRASEAYIMSKNLSTHAEITMEMLAPGTLTEIKSTYFLRYRPECPCGGDYKYNTDKMCWYCTLGGGTDANNGYPHGSGE